MGDNKLLSCREDPPLPSDSVSPVAGAVSTGDWAICLAFVTKWCQATTNCQTFVRVRRPGREGVSDETREEWRAQSAESGDCSHGDLLVRSLEKLPTDFPLYLIFLLCSAGLFVHSVSETRQRPQLPQLPHLLQLQL